MSVDELLPLWMSHARDEAEKRVKNMRGSYESLVNKDSTYGKSIKAMLDVHEEILALWIERSARTRGEGQSNG